MRVVACLAFAAVTAIISMCGGPENPPDTSTSGKTAQTTSSLPATKKLPSIVVVPSSFDPNDSGKSLQWFQTLAKKRLDAPEANEFAVRDAKAEIEKTATSLVGKKIQWKVGFGKLDEEGLRLANIQTDKSCYITVASFARSGGFVVPTGSGWVRSLKPGDQVLVKGTIDRCYAHIRPDAPDVVQLAIYLIDDTISPIKEH